MFDTNTLVGIIKGTPWWVYLVFAWLMYRGIRGFYTQVVPLYRLFILPLVFWAITLTPFLKGEGTLLALVVFIVAAILGLILGFKIVSSRKIGVNKTKKEVVIPGSPGTLIVVSLIFIVRYYTTYKVAIFPAFKSTLTFLLLQFGFGGLAEGFLWGMALCYLKKYSEGK